MRIDCTIDHPHESHKVTFFLTFPSFDALEKLMGGEKWKLSFHDLIPGSGMMCWLVSGYLRHTDTGLKLCWRV